MTVDVILGGRFTLRPIEDEDFDKLIEIVQSPGVREWWWEADDRARLRWGLANEGNAFVVEVDGEIAGWLGFSEETSPGYRHASIDISLAKRFQGQGLGPAAIRTAIRWLAAQRDHRRFTIDPSAANEHAIKAYESVGFQRVGIMRRYERGADGTYHDGLLMDLLIEELR
jgi:aminoglycoside 6'-N-acetyltransferase